MLGATTDKVKIQSMVEVDASREFDEKAAGLDDEQLAKAARLLKLDDLADSPDVPQFLAIAREAAERSIGLRPFDVQLLGALRMMAGDVVEMATGEGKTLSGAIAAAGYALSGRSVHVVTINDYLARRDAEWVGPVIEALGLTVGWITADSTREERRAAYRCDVTYASVNEIGFDVLRDQLVTDVDDLVSPNPDVALIDEADSVLVDEALVPLVLAGTTHRETPTLEIVRLVGELTPGEDSPRTPTAATSTSPRPARRRSSVRSAGSICIPRSTSAPLSPRSTLPCTPTSCCNATCTTSSATVRYS
jgi:preprotein translocase subunit SecA